MAAGLISRKIWEFNGKLWEINIVSKLRSLSEITQLHLHSVFIMTLKNTKYRLFIKGKHDKQKSALTTQFSQICRGTMVDFFKFKDIF